MKTGGEATENSHRLNISLRRDEDTVGSETAFKAECALNWFKNIRNSQNIRKEYLRNLIQ